MFAEHVLQFFSSEQRAARRHEYFEKCQAGGSPQALRSMLVHFFLLNNTSLAATNLWRNAKQALIALALARNLAPALAFAILHN